MRLRSPTTRSSASLALSTPSRATRSIAQCAISTSSTSTSTASARARLRARIRSADSTCRERIPSPAARITSTCSRRESRWARSSSSVASWNEKAGDEDLRLFPRWSSSINSGAALVLLLDRPVLGAQHEFNVALAIHADSLVKVHALERKRLGFAVVGDAAHLSALHPISAGEKCCSSLQNHKRES